MAAANTDLVDGQAPQESQLGPEEALVQIALLDVLDQVESPPSDAAPRPIWSCCQWE
jgi:hypothetical protein